MPVQERIISANWIPAGTVFPFLGTGIFVRFFSENINNET